MAKKFLITSGKSGVGKSTVSALLGMSLANLDKKVLVVELGVGFRTLDVIFGVQDKAIFDLSDVLTQKCEIDKAILKYSGESNLDIVLSPFYQENFIFDSVILKSTFEKLDDKYDYILIDSMDTLTGFKDISPIIDDALIVVIPGVVSLRNCCKISQILSDCGIQNQRMIINKVNDQFFKMGIIPDLDYAIDKVGVQLIGVVYDDKDILDAVENGKKLKKNSQAWSIFNNISRRIMGEDVLLFVR